MVMTHVQTSIRSGVKKCKIELILSQLLRKVWDSVRRSRVKDAIQLTRQLLIEVLQERDLPLLQRNPRVSRRENREAVSTPSSLHTHILQSVHT